MPQVARTGSKVVDEKEANAKAQEQEFKRARGAISCAECRRLKLKCDKTVPCSSCKRRGCASICPNGSLTTGQGTRFILADTDRLHTKITTMSDRIRQLEDALAILQSSVSRDTHPLLRRDLLDIKSSLTLHSATNAKPQIDNEEVQEEEGTYIDAFGTLAVRDDGAATFYGRSAGTESLLLEEKPEPGESRQGTQSAPQLPGDIQRLTSAFPSQPSALGDVDMTRLMENYLPPWPRAANLCDLYLEQSQWFFGPITRRQLLEEVLPLFYPEAAAASASTTTTSAESGPPLSSNVAAFDLPESSANTGKKAYSAHDLALIFVVFCFGALTDPILPPAPYNVEAEQYFQLTRAAMNVEPVLDRPPSVVTVQTLSLMAIYQGLVADENSIESTWALMGLSTRLAQSVGLHRDCARWKLSPQEVQKRRALFWELFITDCWQSLATGRLSGFSIPFVDTELPGDPDQLIAEDGTPLPSFPLWKAKFGKEIVSQVVECTLTVKPPRYSAILDLDRKIRDFELPRFTQEPLPENGGLNLVMSHYMPKNYREFIMLYVHRGYFAMALNDFPTDPLRSQYAPSFLAGYRSACSLLSEMRDQFNKFPVQIARFWVLWTHAFSATVMLGSVVTHGATTKTSQAALAELRLAKDLFEKAAGHGGRAVKFLPAVKRLHDKAQNVFSTGFQRKDIFSVRNPKEEEHDELSIFTGRTRTVATKASSKSGLNTKRSVSRIRKTSSQASASASSTSAMPSPPESSGTRSSDSPKTSADSPGTDGGGGGGTSGAGGGSPSSVPAYARSLESYGNQVHPMLVDQMKAFEGQLDAQISEAEQYYKGVVDAAKSSEDVAMSQASSGSGSGSGSGTYLTPPGEGTYAGMGYQPQTQQPPQVQYVPPPQQQQQQQQQQQSSYGSGSGTQWGVWEQPDMAPPPPPAHSMYQHPQQQHSQQHLPTIHTTHYPHPQTPISPEQQSQHHIIPVYGAFEGRSPTAAGVHGSRTTGAGAGVGVGVAYQQHYTPHTPSDVASFTYPGPATTSHVLQDPNVWDMTPQMAEGEFAVVYQQSHQHSQPSSQHQHQHHQHQQQQGVGVGVGGYEAPPPISQQSSTSSQSHSQSQQHSPLDLDLDPQEYTTAHHQPHHQTRYSVQYPPPDPSQHQHQQQQQQLQVPEHPPHMVVHHSQQQRPQHSFSHHSHAHPSQTQHHSLVQLHQPQPRMPPAQGSAQQQQQQQQQQAVYPPNDGVYSPSLSETWTTFMQSEMQMRQQGQGGYQHQR